MKKAFVCAVVLTTGLGLAACKGEAPEKEGGTAVAPAAKEAPIPVEPAVEAPTAEPKSEPVPANAEKPPEKPEVPAEPKAGEFTLAGPFTHQNLSVMVLRGADAMPRERYLTLQEAMDQELVTVHETGTVEQLEISNTSEELPVFVQAGDLVKGGRQDRVLRTDLVLAPSEKVDIASFCVEQGRWGQRGGEDHRRFGKSSKAIGGGALGYAAKYGGSQSRVWRGVSRKQAKMKSKLAVAMETESPSSLQLTLDHKDVEKATAEYSKALFPAVDPFKDAVGAVFVLNGKIDSAELYGSSRLFRKLWKKQLDAQISSAIEQHESDDKRYDPPTAEAVAAFLAPPGDEDSTRVQEPNKRTKVSYAESSSRSQYSTVDSEGGGEWLHRNYVRLEDGQRSGASTPRYPPTAQQLDRGGLAELLNREQAGVANRIAVAMDGEPQAEPAEGCPRAAVQRVLRRRSGAFRACFEQSLQRNPVLPSRLVLEFTVSASGSAQNAQISAPGLAESVRSCMLRVIRRARFPRPESGSSCSVRYPINVHPSG